MIDVTSLFGRPSITEFDKNAIRDAFAVVPDGKKSALLVIYDIEAKQGRLHYAWKVNDVWKVGAQVGWSLHEKPKGFIGIEASW